MDPSHLLELFSGTFQPDPQIRGQAEEQLKQLSLHQPGFLGACLDILIETQVPGAIRKAAAVYLKNRVCKFWVCSDSQSEFAIDNDEKPVLKDRIIGAIIGSDYQTKQQLIPVLRVLVSSEFNQWPDLTKRTGELLSEGTVGDTQSVSRLYTGLLCFSEICRKFRWQDNADRAKDLYPIITQAFPVLLQVGNALLEVSPDQMSEQLAEMLKLILKAYKFVTYLDLPTPLQSRDQMVAWGEFHGKVTNYTTPRYVGDVDDHEKSMLEISKCYKWSVANMYRLFSRYGSAQSPSKKFSYKEFTTMFGEEFVPHLLNNYLGIIEQWCKQERWLSTTTIYQLLEFFSHAVSQKQSWAQIKPAIDQLVGHVIWPLLCPDDSQLEMYEEDPQEYVHLYFDFNDEYNSPSVAALGFLMTLVSKRRSYTMEPIIKFAHAQLSALGPGDSDLEAAKKKEGIFTMLGGISHIVVPQYGTQMEPFLAELVFPNLTSKYGFLKARAIEIASKYADVTFTNEDALNTLFHGILSSFQSQSDLPVSFCSALAIQAFIGHPQFTPILRNIIVRVMSRLLEISNDIDNDVISTVMQECVENYSEQLQGYGVDLMQKLVEQFLRLAQDVYEQSNQDIDDADFDYCGDKVMAATGLLGTMITILLSFENSRDICLKLEEVMAPAISFCLTHQLDDFLGELAQLIENSTFLLQEVSPITWKHFEGLINCFNSRIALLYLDNLVPCLHNYLVYGADVVSANPPVAARFIEAFNSIAADEDDDDDYGRQEEYVYACQVAQTFILSLKEAAKEHLPGLLTAIYSMTRTLGDPSQAKNTSMNVDVTDVILAALIVDPMSTLAHLQQAGKTEEVFIRWFQLIPQLTRVFDLKLSALAIITLLTSGAPLPAPVVAQMGPHLAKIVRDLPEAMTKLEKRKKEFDAYDVDDNNYKFSDENWGGDSHEWEESFDDDNQGDAQDSEYLEFLQSEEIKNAGFFDKQGEEPVEDPLATSPLDKVDVLQVVREFIVSEPGQQFVGQLNSTDQQAFA